MENIMETVLRQGCYCEFDVGPKSLPMPHWGLCSNSNLFYKEWGDHNIGFHSSFYPKGPGSYIVYTLALK